MCGISGIVGNVFDDSLLHAMTRALRHRGPNATGHYVDPDRKAGLGHNRLSILDTSEAANQPMLSADERYVLVFNGEIYNYLELREELKETGPFRTSSDSEVLLRAWERWGPNCLPRLNGMFAFAIWDVRDKKLFAARDRFGVKPFYYARNKESLVFASEIKALWVAGIARHPFIPVWASYLAKGWYGTDGYTFWDNILELPAGHFLSFDGRRLAVQRWYVFEDEIIKAPVFSREADLEEAYTSLLLDAVALRFRSDVPIGFNISGGLDSSALLAAVDHLFPSEDGISAFTFHTNDCRYDELPWVQTMMQHRAHPLNTCLLTAQQVTDRVKQMSEAQDEPFGGIPTLAYSRVFEEAAKSVVVLLDGQGMDEAWAGYDYYETHTGHIVQGSTTAPVRAEILTDDFRACTIVTRYHQPFNDLLLNLQYRDLFYTKIPRALRFNDRVSMMYSTELREPFLDYRLVEMAFAQHRHMKIRDGQRKWLLRRIATRFLGEEITQAPKRPVQTPQREWLAGPLSELVRTSIDILSDTGWFNPSGLRKEWKLYQEGAWDNSFYVWQWINTALLLSN